MTMRYHANREGDAARRHAIDAYRRHGLRERVCRATATAATIPAALALLALLAGATPALARGPVDSQAKGATCTPSARVICADAAGGPPGPKAAPPPGTYHLERTGADHGGAGADTRAARPMLDEALRAA